MRNDLMALNSFKIIWRGYRNQDILYWHKDTQINEYTTNNVSMVSWFLRMLGLFNREGGALGQPDIHMQRIDTHLRPYAKTN